MPLTVLPVFEDLDIAAEVGEVDLSQPLSEEVRQAIRAAFVRHPVLVFPQQELSDEQHLAFATSFGPLETFSIARAEDRPARRPG